MKGFVVRGACLAISIFALVVPGPQWSIARAESRGPESKKMLSFADRVAYQRAIEEVYWRHRIWPKENAQPKPSLDEVMSAAEIEKKVKAYLRDSQLLADQWQQPITSGQLQAEMDRIAQHTRQPDVLHELFAALGNDPFVIAECLARPVLADHFVYDLTAHDESARKALESVERSTANVMSMSTNVDEARYKLPNLSVPLDCTDDTWTATSTTNAPVGRFAHTAIWTGSEMIIWGGVDDNFNRLRTGGKYIPSTDTWTATSITNAPTARGRHTAVWTGSEMIVWGGNMSNTGGRYNPTTNSWTATSTANAPGARDYHCAVWTGSEMIVWGGGFGSGSYLNTGGRYDPSTNSWTATDTTNAPAGRNGHTAVWTDGEMIIWGGSGSSSNYLNTGGRYISSTNSWTATSTTNAPVGRTYHAAVWTGSEMIVWGGTSGGSLQTGGRYDPSTDSWTPTSTTSAPAARHFHTAEWTGSEMIVWGGTNVTPFNTGGRYDPNTDSWTATNTTNAPAARDSHTAVFTGSEMIVWGGFAPSKNTGGRYCVQPNTPMVQSAVSRKSHGAAGNFDVDLPLSGTPGLECRTGGATNDYTIVITFLADVSVSGNPQATVTSGIGSVGSGGVDNGGAVITSGNVVIVPLTNVANAQTIGVTLNNVNGSTNVTIPMSVLVGDANGNGAVNASDVSVTKSRVGQTIDAMNFRSDVNANGIVNASDVSLAKSAIGTALP